MSDRPSCLLSLSDMVAERDALRELEQRVWKELERWVIERPAERGKSPGGFEVTDKVRLLYIAKLRQAFSRGESDLMLVSFPSNLCSDGGREVADARPLDQDRRSYQASVRPAWLPTLPTGVRSLYEFWEEALKQGGFGFEARILSHPEGRTGDVGLFITWPPDVSRLMH